MPKKRPKPSRKVKARRRPKKKPAKKLSKVERLQQQVEYLRRKVQRYERQRFAGPIQPGKKRRKVPKAELEKVRTELKAFLEGAKRQLAVGEDHPTAATYRSYENADQSVDAEIRVHLEDHGDIEGTFIDLEDAGDWNALSDYWIMIGIQVSADEKTGSPTIDKRPQRAWTNPVRGNRSGAAFFTARETVTRNLEQWGAQASMIVVRIFWSPDNDRPRRRR